MSPSVARSVSQGQVCQSPVSAATARAKGTSRVVAAGLYEGWVSHTRRDAMNFSFRRKVAMPLVDLERVDELLDQHPLASRSRFAPVQFRRDDYGGDPHLPLPDAVVDGVEAELGRRPAGPVMMLGQLRTWWWLFNPIVVHYVFDGRDLDALVLEVTSTPWHERAIHVVDARGSAPREGEERSWPIEVDIAKSMHVSPFLPMDLSYRFRARAPGEDLALGIECWRGEDRVLDTWLLLRRRHDLDRAALTRLMLRHGLGTYGVSAGIYWEAMRLWRAGARFRPHPGRSG